MQISLHGGQALSWRTERGEELLFTSTKVTLGFTLPFWWDLWWVNCLLLCQILNFPMNSIPSTKFKIFSVFMVPLSIGHFQAPTCCERRNSHLLSAGILTFMHFSGEQLWMHLTSGFASICVSLETGDR